MVIIFVYIIVVLYGISLFMILLYSLSQLSLLINYLRAKHAAKLPLVILKDEALPFVTIQLPVYNEKYVMERLLNCVAATNYPLHKLQIQVLDDSTDDSLQTNEAQIAQLKASGINIVHLHRTNRTDYKAGALKEGLTKASGEFIAIFDADFMPGADWLRTTVSQFTSPEIGVVQTRWGHINRGYSYLTKTQAFALDAHFTLEQAGRNAGGHFINFNGTAGIWRKSCIIDAGNWKGDTLTEDLDLSYRAQLRKWKFKFLENVVAPAELPVVISAARSQQFRWNKGGAENFLKLIPTILRAKDISIATKFHSVFHLVNSTMFFFILTVSVLSVPMLYIKNTYAHFDFWFSIHSFFLVSTLILFCCHWVVYKTLHGNGFQSFVKYISMFFTFFTIALGFSLHNSLAVAEAYRGKKSPFIRTPKFNIQLNSDSWKGNTYLSKQLSLNVLIEILLWAYFGFGLFSAFRVSDFTMIPFHLMLFIGFGYVIFLSVKPEVSH